MKLTGKDQYVFPMVNETMKFLDKKLGYKFKDKVVCSLKDHDWVKDHTGVDGYILRFGVTASRRGYNQAPNTIHHGFQNLLGTPTPKVQALVLSMETADQPLGVLFLFDNSCESVTPEIESDEQYTTLYIYSSHIHRSKSPPINILNMGQNKLGCYPESSNMYATAKTKMECELPSGFRATLTKFYGCIRDTVEEPRAWKSYGFHDQKRRLQTGLESAVNKNVQTFNDTLEKLFSDHLYEGVAMNAKGIAKQQYLIRELFKNPERLRRMMETYEQQQGSNLLAEIDKVEDDVALLQKAVCKHKVVHFQASDKVLHMGESDDQQEWFATLDDFIAAIDPVVTNKMCILDATMDRKTNQTPYVAGVGFAMDEKQSGSMFGNTFIRMYDLDSQNDGDIEG